jgi:hypothetical protein
MDHYSHLRNEKTPREKRGCRNIIRLFKYGWRTMAAAAATATKKQNLTDGQVRNVIERFRLRNVHDRLFVRCTN